MKKDPLSPPTANLATAIIGFWKLKSREDVDATGKVHIDPFLGRDPLGILCFGKTHFSAQFMKHISERCVWWAMNSLSNYRPPRTIVQR
jgi:Lipocalin-like domain